MSIVLVAIVPVFGLIGLGFAAQYWRILSPETGKALSEFIFRLAIPALLFRTMLEADLSGTSVAGLWAVQFATAAFGWITASLATKWLLGRPAADGVVMAMSTAHGNLLLLGLPVALSAFGPAAAPSIAILLSLHSPVLWLAGSLHMAAATRSADAGIGRVAGGLAAEMGRNPVVLSLVAGTLARISGIEIHPAIDRLLAMLAAASVPCALVALGISLGRFQIRGEARSVAVLLLLKLALMPLFAWLLATSVFALSPIQVAVVVLFCAMPAGANAFLFADRHGYAVGSTSAAVAIGTALSSVSTMGLIYVLAPR